MADLAIKSKEQIFDLIKRVAAKKYPDADWTGLRVGSFEWLMAQVVAEVAELNGYYLDLRSKGAYLSSAQVRKDVRDIAANLGLVPSERTAASVSLAIVATDDVTISKGTSLTTTNGEVFSTLEELILETAGVLTGTVLAIHSDYELLSHRARGDAGEVISLNREDILIENLTITVDGEIWDRVNNLFGQSVASRVYRVIFDERNRVSIKFGDGVYGRRVAADANIVIDVYSGGGPAGNAVGAGTITSFLSSFANSSNISSVTNTLSPTGGGGADSLDEIAERIPGQLRQIAGLINPEDIAQVIKANLSFVSDANVERGHTTVNGVYVPKVTVSAYPNNDSIVAMTSAQSADLSEFLARRGQIGVLFAAQDAYQAPIEIEVDVSLSNKNLEARKEAEIKAALRTNAGAPFAFNNLGFNAEYTLQNILNIIESVDGVVYAKMSRFGKIPHGLVTAGFSTSVDGLADIELGDDAEDGYFQFRADATNSAVVSFFRPFSVNVVGSDFVRSTGINWLVEEHSYEGGTQFNDTEGPYIKISSSKIEFKQHTRVWKTDQWNGSTYNEKYLLKVQYVDTAGTTQTWYYHIADTTAPGTLTTVEDADTPINASGGILTSLAGTGLTSIVVQIIKDQTFGSLYTAPRSMFMTPQGINIPIKYNSNNSLYLSSDPSGTVPVTQHSYIHFNETALDLTTTSWVSSSGALRMRLYPSAPLSLGDIIEVYTTGSKADRLKFKHPREVFTLADANININFI